MLDSKSTTLLRKGLSFIPTKICSKDEAHKLASFAISRLEKNLKWTEHYAGEPPPSDVNKRLLLPSPFIPPEGTYNLKRFISGLRENMRDAINDCTPTKINYNKKDLIDLYKIGCTTDKNLGPHYLPRSWALNEAHRQLSDKQVYENCPPARREAVCRRLDSFINNNDSDQFGLSKKEYEGLTVKTGEAIFHKRWPKFRLLPKVHKLKEVSFKNLDQLKGRPIIGAHSCPSSYLSIYVDAVLARYAWAGKNVLRDTKSLARELTTLKLPSNTIIATADVASLYPSIPTQWGCRVVKKYLLQKGMHPKRASFVYDALKLVLTSNVFTYDDKFYIQVRGTAMGTHCAPTYATIVLVVLEQSSKINWEDIYFFRRFIDDLLIFGKSTTAIESFLASYSDVREEINLTSEMGDSIDFMNLTIFKDSDFNENGLLSYKPFAKKFNKFLYLPFTSAHPPHMKKAFVKGLVSSLVINSSKFSLFKHQLGLCYDRLRARGYPLSLLRPIFTSVSYHNRINLLKPPVITDSRQVQVLNIPYNNIFSRIPVGKIIAKNYERSLATYFTVLTRPIVSWSRTHNVSDIINIAHNRQTRREGPPKPLYPKPLGLARPLP